MKGKIAGMIALLTSLLDLIAHLSEIGRLVKMIDKTFILEGIPIVIVVVAGSIYLFEKYKGFKKLLQSMLLIIDSAEYGAEGQTKDVAHILWSKIVSGRIENFPVTNDTLGPDPIPRVHKVLTVKYKYHGENLSISVPENGTLSIPEGKK